MIKENIYVAINRNDEIQWVRGSSKKTRYFRTDRYLKGTVEYHNKYHPDDIWKVRKCVILEDEPNSSEKPNNCEDEDIFEYCPRCGMRMLSKWYEPQNMAEDIVRSFGFKAESYRQAKAKTEPQTCDDCRFDNRYGIESICTECSRHYSDCYAPTDEQNGIDWKDQMWAEAIVTEPTISKMEQVDKDINVRSKDEPQTERSE